MKTNKTTTVTIKKSGNKSKSITYIVALPATIVESWGINMSSTKEERQLFVKYDNNTNSIILSPQQGRN